MASAWRLPPQAPGGRKLRLDRAADRLADLEAETDETAEAPAGPTSDPESWLEARGVAASGFETSLGTVGGGNHFAEVQLVEEVRDADAFGALGLDPERVLLLVHSGSRGFGHQILTTHLDRHGATGLEAESDSGRPTASRPSTSRVIAAGFTEKAPRPRTRGRW